MDNYDISDALGLYAKLAELHEENPFKVKSYAAAAFNIKKIKDPLDQLPESDLDKVPGVGKSVISAIRQLLQNGTFPDLEKMLQMTPPGVLAMMKIKGLGPKKVGVIWRNMGIDSVELLFDACRENRLVEQPGFGLKTQGEVIRAIEFSWNASGKYHFARVEKPAAEIIGLLAQNFPAERFELTGDVRRHSDIMEWIELLGTLSESEATDWLSRQGFNCNGTVISDAAGFRYKYLESGHSDFDRVLFETSATPSHLADIGYDSQKFQSELQVYQHAGLPLIPVEMREGAGEVDRIRNNGKLDSLLEFSDLKGILHNHSTWSDGLHSLREMAEYCRDQGYQYLGICDHSKSAGYAGGLQPERVLKQWEEIDMLNRELAPFRIFKGIESDILSDGSLDYDSEILAGFELVVASVHSNLKMDEDKANFRLIRAIENPYTHILGHPTGRLLLVREGYPVNHRYIIDACAANGVAIEVNANPFRLDLDWRWVGYAMDKGVMLSINPDAHEKSAYHDMYYGTLSARKGGLTSAMTLNALTLEELDNWLKNKRISRAV